MYHMYWGDKTPSFWKNYTLYAINTSTSQPVIQRVVMNNSYCLYSFSNTIIKALKEVHFSFFNNHIEQIFFNIILNKILFISASKAFHSILNVLKNLFKGICGWLFLNNFKPGMHLFPWQEQLVPPKDCSYTSICWVFALHKESTAAVHRQLHLATAVSLIKLHTHLSLQSIVT